MPAVEMIKVKILFLENIKILAPLENKKRFIIVLYILYLKLSIWQLHYQRTKLLISLSAVRHAINLHLDKTILFFLEEIAPGAPDWNRTSSHRLRRPEFYPLNYGRAFIINVFYFVP